MKKSSLILLLFIIGGFSVAWAVENSSTQSSSTQYENQQNVFYFADGVIKRTTLGHQENTREVERLRVSPVAQDVEYLFNWNENAILFARKNSDSSRQTRGNDLWLYGKVTGETHKVFEDVSMASISPDGKMLAVTTMDSQMYLVSRVGKIIHKLKNHAGSAAFSPDGSKIAYARLSDDPSQLEMGSPKMFQGIALYDLETQKDRLVLSSDTAYGVTTWQPNGERIYFASRENNNFPEVENAMWSIRVDGNDLWQETVMTKGQLPSFLSETTVWSADGLTAIESGIDLFSFNEQGAVQKVQKIEKGDTVRSFEKGKSVVYRTQSGEWKFFDLSQKR